VGGKGSWLLLPLSEGRGRGGGIGPGNDTRWHSHNLLGEKNDEGASRPAAGTGKRIAPTRRRVERLEGNRVIPNQRGGLFPLELTSTRGSHRGIDVSSWEGFQGKESPEETGTPSSFSRQLQKKDTRPERDKGERKGGQSKGLSSVGGKRSIQVIFL